MLEEHCNPRLVKELLRELGAAVHALTKGVGKCVLVGNINIWLLRLDTIHHWQLQLNNLHIPKVEPAGWATRSLGTGVICVSWSPHPLQMVRSGEPPEPVPLDVLLIVSSLSVSVGQCK